MTALATGSSASVTLRDNGKCTVATNGGDATVVETVAGVSTTHAFGPRPMRMTFGPYSEGATLVITNSSAVLDYDAGSNVVFLNDQLLAGDAVVALSEVSAYVTRTTTGTAHTGVGEFGGYICTVAAGNITIYDNTSAAGTVLVPTTALAVGAFPIMGAGTNTRLALTTGCHVVLSGAATVNILVQ